MRAALNTNAVRVGWMLLACFFLVGILWRQREATLQAFHALAAWQFALAGLFLVLGKLAYVGAVRSSLLAYGVDRGWWLPFYAYNISQLGKYIPGSIWQFVGRFAIYRANDISPARAAQLLALENFLMLLAAALVSVYVLPAYFHIIAAHVPVALVAAGAAALLVLAAAVLVLSRKVRQRLLDIARAAGQIRKAVFQIFTWFLLMWVLLGLSAYVLVLHAAPGWPSFAFYMISLFAVSYVAGFLFVLAPAGVGVREAVFTIGLFGIVEPEVAITLAVSHRVAYVATDLVLGFAAWFGNRAATRRPALSSGE